MGPAGQCGDVPSLVWALHDACGDCVHYLAGELDRFEDTEIYDIAFRGDCEQRIPAGVRYEGRAVFRDP